MDTNTVIGNLITFVTANADYALVASFTLALGSIVTLLTLGHKELKNVEGCFEELSTGTSKSDRNLKSPIRPVAVGHTLHNPEHNMK